MAAGFTFEKAILALQALTALLQLVRIMYP